MRRHHEVPTHLNVEDKVLFGLTVRQFLYMLVGSSVAYTVWEQSVSLGDLVRVALSGFCVGVTLAFALLRPAGRPLEEWLAAALVYAAAPRRSTWQPREPEPTDWQPAAGGWQELTPSLSWAEDDHEWP
ncbi:MAG: PrgI family protein [Chloroflexi bacterium]|nr:PrgI family protein [Chloroflexota bacterium]MBV9600667.1 PrgI family protein [Chloroflexota bacterium]